MDTTSCSSVLIHCDLDGTIWHWLIWEIVSNQFISYQ